MRITTNMMYNRGLSSLSAAAERQNTAYEQLYSGDKFKTAGQDPSGMSQKMALTKEIDLFQQYGVNGSLLENSLGHEETILSSLNDAMLSAQTLMQKANDSALSQTDRESVAKELEGLQQQMFDLMNSKNSQGEYIFGGNQSKTQPFVKDPSGNYVFQGDTGQREIQVSSTVRIPANDSGLDLFETVPTRRTASADTADIQVKVGAQGQFDNFYRTNYDSALASNKYTVTTVAGVPDSYQITDVGGNVLQNGDYVAGEDINFNGLTLNLSQGAGTVQEFSLDQPKNDNILNGISDFLGALRDPNLSNDDFQLRSQDAQAHLGNARQRMDTGLGALGGRMNSLEQVMSSNTGLDTLNQQARAKVSEIDLYEVISTLSKENAAMSASQQAFSNISKLTLFDYIR
ncbi:flagellar hook-associated protein FlgL [Aeromonas rivuli]|jgi:flagellar hook-associated protein 3 FlgL|uniref:flagellar hook-associated protein FlgL n=1 Tax=Aeromonas TaxID=642 RepID=UPI0005A7AC2C|nr:MULTISPECIES: flagellar hook-associated protein FlgL [Aeromonas]MCS3455460.1 flagellar hook-associated protein 3 FlgL [Aeromonas sp. BIGb0405]MCS3458440.1 flagellar hook-associated protein 3 FlgL [Aeromonas sp. BIGb0445]UBO72819.1 flagellar hook-associated protein FlgL [Aeromonas rivuli]